MQPSEEFGANVVMTDLRPGFQLHDRVIRPSQVFVSTGPETSNQPCQPTTISATLANTPGSCFRRLLKIPSRNALSAARKRPSVNLEPARQSCSRVADSTKLIIAATPTRNQPKRTSQKKSDAKDSTSKDSKSDSSSKSDSTPATPKPDSGSKKKKD